MSAHKVKYKDKVIIDFTNKRINHNSVSSRLRKTKIVESYIDSNSLTVIRNRIKVGRYLINIKMPLSALKDKRATLTDDLAVDILEENINLSRATHAGYNIFEDQPWFKNYVSYKVDINDVTEIILYCKRLDELVAFS